MSSAASSVFTAPAAAFLRRCRDKAKRAKIYDSTGASCTGNELLLRSLILRRLLRREVFKSEGGYVALLLPPSVPSVIANMAVSLDRRVAVNLNYTASSETLDACLKLCGIKQVITSRRVLEKLDLKLNAEMIALEDLRPKVKLTDKLAAAWSTYVSSTGSLERKLQLDKIRPDDELTVIFTSGSTGVPKGVVLTQGNVATNVDAIREVIRLRSDDVIVGVLPFFHSFGYTVTLWGAMNLDVSAAYHYSPLDAKQVGKLCKEYQATVLLATPTFLRNYLKRCASDELRTLQIVVAGAEKLPKDVADEFERKFGVRPVEGYGTTELSPLVSVNVPPTRDPHDGRILAREGTVGLPIPNVQLRINDLDSGEVLGPEQSGMLWVKGPNVMKGYLHREDLTHEVIVDGWYKTGDVAMVDREGFLHITGRVSRFSKIGGEMVPHILIEESLNRVIAAVIGKPDEVEAYAAVTAVPDPKKGERLIVLHTPVSATVDAMRQGLLAAGLPPLYVPAADSFFEVEEIPMLGSGKLDLTGLERRAKELAAGTAG